MPNFWSRQIQKLDERRKGPRTVDKDFHKLLEDMDNVEDALIKLKSLCEGFTHNFERIMEFNREISAVIFLLYNNSTQYTEFSTALTKIHIENNLIFQSLLHEIDVIIHKTIEWPKYFANMKLLIQQREMSRKVYDHYEKKLKKLKDIVQYREKKGCLQFHPTFIEYVIKNKNKYINAKEDYIRKASNAYESIQKLVENRFALVNPVLVELFKIETTLFSRVSRKYSIYKGIEKQLEQVKTKYQQGRRYDPTRHMRNPNLDAQIRLPPYQKAKKKEEDKNAIEMYSTRKCSILDRNKGIISERKRSLTGEDFNLINNFYSANEPIEEDNQPKNILVEKYPTYNQTIIIQT